MRKTKVAPIATTTGTNTAVETLEIRFKKLTADFAGLKDANERVLITNERLQSEINQVSRDCDRARGERDQARKEMERIMEVLRLVSGKGRDKYDDHPFFRGSSR